MPPAGQARFKGGSSSPGHTDSACAFPISYCGGEVERPGQPCLPRSPVLPSGHCPEPNPRVCPGGHADSVGLHCLGLVYTKSSSARGEDFSGAAECQRPDRARDGRVAEGTPVRFARVRQLLRSIRKSPREAGPLSSNPSQRLSELRTGALQ
jgi:hypothetical protein